ncbi:uncharacterized protein UBRO_06923 [Ustilago bromivora]|uniref:DUF6533 domain-containing protein n=1 Tax=Ustilago bromivora TaxID=307758 RepID=A0A1K0H8J5_9BASI|nr:uncharacterized protein UBRO_06923 [Ustilago bromivora]
MSDANQQADWLARLCNNTASPTPRTNEDLVAAGILLPSYDTHDAFVNNVAIVAATLYCWEYIMTVPSEIQIYFSIPWTAPHLVLFVLMRYSTLIAITLGLYATWHRQHGNCIAYSEVATLLVQVSVSAVLGWRTIAIWQKDARIIVIIGLLLTTLMVFSSLLVLSMKSERLQNGACVLVQNGNYESFPLYWFYAGTVVYDTLVIVLSTYRLWQHHNDVGVFPGANVDDTSKGGIGWARWMHSQWNSITPLLFRLTSNGVLYLAFSTGFNVVCFLIGHWNEARAQDMMLLWSSVMWVVCQRLVLLEIRATWGDGPGAIGLRSKGVSNSETDGLIVQILQSSWACKAPLPNNNGQQVDTSKEERDPEIVLSLSVDSCLKAAPTQCCGGGAQQHSSQTLGRVHTRQTSTGQPSIRNTGLEESTVQQLHDFRPCIPGDSYDGLGSRSNVNSERMTTMDGDLSTNALITQTNETSTEDKRSSGFRNRLGALRNTNSSNKLLATLTKSSREEGVNVSIGSSEAAPPSSTSNAIDHPLMDLPHPTPTAPRQQRDSTSSKFLRISQAFDRSPKLSATAPDTSVRHSTTTERKAQRCNCARRSLTTETNAVPRRKEEELQMKKSASAGDVISSLEIAHMLANMSDDAKSTALALAGMENSSSLPSGSSFTSAIRTETERPRWIIHPPLM